MPGQPRSLGVETFLHAAHAARLSVRWLLAVGLMAATSLWAQTYPAKSITLVVPFTAGGITDAGARLVARKLADELKQPVVVENRAGAGGSIGAKAVASAPADGYTLLLGTLATQVVNAAVLKSALPYDPLRDFAAVHGVMAVPIVIVTRPDLPFKTVPALLEAARAKPGSLNYASPGAGTAAHLSAELFQVVTKTKLLHVPYKGSAQAITDLLGGNLDLAFDYASSTEAHIQAGKLTALAVTGPSRLAALPQVPTMRELGVPEAEVTSWLGLFAPAGTPAAAIERLRQAMERIMREPDAIEGIARLGGQPLPLPPVPFTAFVQGEFRRWGGIVEQAGIKPN